MSVPPRPPAPAFDPMDSDIRSSRAFQSLLDEVLGDLPAAAPPSSPAPSSPPLPGRDTATLLREVLAVWTSRVPLRPAPPPRAAVSVAAAILPEKTETASVTACAALVSEPEMVRLIAEATPDGAGTLEMPARLDALAALLATPADDFVAQDLLWACWPERNGITSRAALAAALNLSHNFGRDGRLPMAECKAWRLLDPTVFSGALRQRLAAIVDFVLGWQRSQRLFLYLDHGEIELIEYLFETLDPIAEAELLAQVMEFKVLSGRRFGLLRRISVRARRRIEKMEAPQALADLERWRPLLALLADGGGFPPVAEAAARARSEIDRLTERITSRLAPPAVNGRPAGMPLGRIDGRQT